jgi:choline dehydrogenase-like flavoprotein
VHERWARDLGLTELSERAFEPAYAEVEGRIGVREVPVSARSRSTDKFVEGALRLGIEMHPTRRNTEGCEGNARCNFGCPAGAKMSVDISYLPGALAHGARVVADALVERVDIEGGRAVGVSGRLIGGEAGEPRYPFRVRAPVVVVACGTLHTPLLLGASGIGCRSHELGRHVTLHPATRVTALFDDELRGWDGALQSAYCDQFAGDGITLVGVYSPVNVLAATLPGVGPAHRQRFSETAHHAVFGAMVHDEGGGRVRRGPGREPILTYRMAERDLSRLRRGIHLLAEIALAGGAHEVYVPIFGTEPIRSMDDNRRLEASKVDARRIECIAFHPLGSARMARDARHGVVDPQGQSFDVEGLYVADGSVLPTSIGVNSQVPIMSMATRIAWGIREKLARRAA